jgi:NADH-quinone oxidoreductase subunit M
LRDHSAREIAVFAPLVVLAFAIGIYPKPLFTVLERPTQQIVERLRTGGHSLPVARELPSLPR